MAGCPLELPYQTLNLSWRIRSNGYDRLAVPEADRARMSRMWRGPVVVETCPGKLPTGLSAADKTQPYEVALTLRENGRAPYRIRFDAEADVWVAHVIDWGLAA